MGDYADFFDGVNPMKDDASSLTEAKLRAAIAQVMQRPKGFSTPACRCCGEMGVVVRQLSLRGAPYAKVVLCEGCDIRRTTDGSWPAGAPCSKCARPLEAGAFTIMRSGEWLCAGCVVRADDRSVFEFKSLSLSPDLGTMGDDDFRKAAAQNQTALEAQFAAEKTRLLELEVERLTKLELERRMKGANPFVVTGPGGRGLTAAEVRDVMLRTEMSWFGGKTGGRSPSSPLPTGPAPRRMRLGEEEET